MSVFSGLKKVSLRGDAIADRHLIQLAHANRGSLDSITIKSTRHVSDKAVTVLVLLCTRIESFWLDDVQSSEGPFGVFLGLLLETCSDLVVLHLNRIRMVDMKASCPNLEPWRAKTIKEIHLRQLGEGLSLSWIWPSATSLKKLALDRTSENVQEGVASWYTVATVLNLIFH